MTFCSGRGGRVHQRIVAAIENTCCTTTFTRAWRRGRPPTPSRPVREAARQDPAMTTASNASQSGRHWWTGYASTGYPPATMPAPRSTSKQHDGVATRHYSTRPVRAISQNSKWQSQSRRSKKTPTGGAPPLGRETRWGYEQRRARKERPEAFWRSRTRNMVQGALRTG